MTLEALCNLRDKLIMDPSLSLEEQEFLFGMLDEQIHAAR
jgi:hypothetical protein